jgi:hypothetical protein
MRNWLSFDWKRNSRAPGRFGGRTAYRAAGLLLGSSILGTGVAADADPLPAPSFIAPLAANPNPFAFDGGPFGKVFVTGQVSGLGLVQSHTQASPGTGNAASLFDLDNAQVEIQTTSGPVQFYLQAGAYSLPALGTPYLRTGNAVDQEFGELPVAYMKFVPMPEISVQVGALPTLIGAESTFSFQNMNIERGLLWNQEPAISKGVQLNYSKGKLTAAISLNDGYDSNRYNWLSGQVALAINGSNTLIFAAGGNFSHTFDTDFVAPVAQGNSNIFNIIYSYTHGKLTLSPYIQYSHVGRNRDVGLDTSAQTFGGAVLAAYSITPEVSLAGRAEYITTWGGDCGGASGCTPTNLLYGPGSNAWSLTVTPTFHRGIFFARGEVSYTHIGHLTAGLGFGDELDQPAQIRALVETGVLF